MGEGGGGPLIKLGLWCARLTLDVSLKVYALHTSFNENWHQ